MEKKNLGHNFSWQVELFMFLINNLWRHEFFSSHYFEEIRYVLFRKDENIEDTQSNRTGVKWFYKYLLRFSTMPRINGFWK
jgi:hypothetical protein